jgi:hypothetical protein
VYYSRDADISYGVKMLIPSIVCVFKFTMGKEMIASKRERSNVVVKNSREEYLRYLRYYTAASLIESINITLIESKFNLS